jgi:hypothetical protein
MTERFRFSSLAMLAMTSASWRRMMGGLDRHFSENASLDPATQADILRFLEAHAADSGTSQMGQ